MGQSSSHEANEPSYDPNFLQRLLEGDTFQRDVIDSPHLPVRVLGIAATGVYANAAGLVERIDTMVGTAEDEAGLALPYRMAIRVSDRIGAIENPLLKEAAENAFTTAVIGHAMVRSVIEDIQGEKFTD